MNVFNSSFENMLRQLESEFQSYNEDNNNSNTFISKYF